MDFTKQVQNWAKGDAQQGRVMVGIGLIAAVAVYFIYTNESSLINGMLIPAILLLPMNLGYGGFLAATRVKHGQSAIALYQKNPKEAIQQELEKAERDNKAYTMAKPIWLVLIVVSIILFFVFSNDYYKGLTIGLVIMFLTVYFIDSALHKRLQPYLNVLRG